MKRKNKEKLKNLYQKAKMKIWIFPTIPFLIQEKGSFCSNTRKY